MARSSAQREQLAEEGRDAGRSLKKENNRAKNVSLMNSSTDSKGATFVTLIHYASASVRTKRFESIELKQGGQPK